MVDSAVVDRAQAGAETASAYLSASKPAPLRRIGNRADGWQPVVSLPGAVDLDTLRRDRRIIDDAAAAAGRATTEIHTYVRINVAKDTSPKDVAAALRTLEDSGYPDAFVDLLYVATGIDERLQWVETLLASKE